MEQRESFTRRRRATMLHATLLGVPFIDELIAGFLPVGLPLIEADLRLSYGQVGLLFTAGSAAALVLEPIMNVLSDRGGKRPWVLGGVIVLALGFALAASAPSFVVLLIAFAITPTAGGAAVGLDQAVLIDAAPHDAARTMTRWTLLAGVGDLLSPAAVALVAALSLGWRSLFWLAALVWLLAAVVLWRQHFPHPVRIPTGGEDEPALLQGVRTALRTPRLLRWIGVVVVASMLDEIFLGFAGLYLTDAIGATPAGSSVALGAMMAGGLAALVVLDRVPVRWRAERLVAGLALVTLGGVVILLRAPSIMVAAGALFMIGAGAAGWYPLAKAQAYQLLPGRSGTVRAVAGLGEPVEIALPLVVGAVADRFGITSGLAVLGIAPILVLVLLPWRAG